MVIGDKSRYQFFRYMVNMDMLGIKNEFYTENIGQRDLYLTSDKELVGRDTFYSRKIPLNTIVYFPKDFETFSNISESEDRIIVFDEFPYGTEEEILRLEQIADSQNWEQLQVVLFQNNRIGLESDLSTMEMAIAEAKVRYEKRKIPVCRYKIHDTPDFLFWSATPYYARRKEVLDNMLNGAKLAVETFESYYDFSYTTELSIWLEDPTIINEVLKFDFSFKGENIWNCFYNRFFYYFWGNNSLFDDFMIRIYKDSISEFCIWDLNRDIEDMKRRVRILFKEKIKSCKDLVFSGTERDYEKFLSENKVELISFKKKIIGFFSKDLKFYLKNRLKNNIIQMERIIQ